MDKSYSPKELAALWKEAQELCDKNKLEEIISYRPKFFLHAGADLFHVTNTAGNRKMVVIETNSSPSGQKSLPLLLSYCS